MAASSAAGTNVPARSTGRVRTPRAPHHLSACGSCYPDRADEHKGPPPELVAAPVYRFKLKSRALAPAEGVCSDVVTAVLALLRGHRRERCCDTAAGTWWMRGSYPQDAYGLRICRPNKPSLSRAVMRAVSATSSQLSRTVLT